MPLILGAQSAVAGGDLVTNSCQFDGSAKLTKTLGTPTDLNMWTWSAWVKLGAVSTLGYLFECTTGASNFTAVKVDSTARFFFGNYNSGYLGQRDLARLLRDPTAWYHLVAIWDSDNGTPADRMQLWINGVRQTSFHGTTNPTSGEACQMASGADLWVGVHQSTNDYFQGYMAEVCFIDGQALTPTSFGEYNEDSPGIWQPIDVSGLTFGNNGFYLDFEDSANLGNDANGGTDLTGTNIAAVDQMTDTPNNNFATLQPLENYFAASTFSNSNLDLATNASNKAFNVATIGLTAGKWYWETKITTDNSSDMFFGVSGMQCLSSSQHLGTTDQEYAYRSGNGNKETDNVSSAYGNTYTAADIIGCALDLTNMKIYWSKNNVWQDSGDPTSGASGTGAAFTLKALNLLDFGYYTPAWGEDGAQTDYIAVNFGNPSYTNTSDEADGNGYGRFEYAPPSGYLAICTKNLGSDGG